MEYRIIGGKRQPVEFARRLLGFFRSRKALTMLVLTMLALWCMENLVEDKFKETEGYMMTIVREQALEDLTATKQVINLAFVLHNGAYMKQFYTLVKNILYYQGRSSDEDGGCKPKIKTIQNIRCPKMNSGKVKTIHLHLLTPYWVQRETRAYFMQSNLTDMEITYYHWKLALMIGGVFEQRDLLQKLPSAGLFPILKTGVNSGVLLLDLEKIRRTNWTVWWRQVEREMKSSPPGIPYADQGIINTMLYRRPEIFHEVSCEWNFIPSKSKFKDYCLVAWVVRVPGGSECLPPLLIRNDVIRLVSIVHLAGMEKPEQILGRPYYGNPLPVKDYREFSAEDMRNTFTEVYYAFRRMDIRCFS